MSSHPAGRRPLPEWEPVMLVQGRSRLKVRIQRTLGPRPVVTLVAAAGGISTILLGLTLLLQPFEGQLLVALLDLLPIPVFAAASLLAVFAGRRSADRQRTAWWLLAASFCIYGLGDATWAVYEVGFRVAPGTPSPADAFYLAAIPLLFAGVMFLSSSARTLGHFRTGLDAALVVLALVALVWDAIIQPTLAAAETGLAGTLVTVAYPVGDVMLVFGVLVALRRQWRGRARVLLHSFAAGLLLATVADLGYARMVLDGTYHTGTLIDLAWPAGFLLMGLAAAFQARWPVDLAHEDPHHELSYLSQLLPILTSVALAVWLFLRGITGGLSDDGPLLAIVTAAVVVAVVRHSVALADSRVVRRALTAARQGRLWRLVQETTGRD